MRELEEHCAREERIAEATPALGEALRDEDRAVALPDVSVGVAGTTMRESAKLLVQGAQDTFRVQAELSTLYILPGRPGWRSGRRGSSLLARSAGPRWPADASP